LADSLISIVIPVYNVENYLCKCVDSLLVQSYPDLEIILVNDGSSDKSGDICEKYKQADSRVKVIHQSNLGPSAARNAGINATLGQWIMFVDSDDWAEPDMCEKLLEAVTSEDIKLAVCGFRTHMPCGTTHDAVLTDAQPVIPGEKALEYNTRSGRVFPQTVFGKLFNRELIGNLRFDQSLFYGEDVLFNIETLSTYTGNVAYVSMCLYHYRIREGSLMNSFSSKRLTILDTCEKIYNHLKPISQKLSLIARAHIVNGACSLIRVALDSGGEAYVPGIARRARPHLFAFMKSDNYGFNRKLVSVIVIMSPSIGNKIWKLTTKNI